MACSGSLESSHSDSDSTLERLSISWWRLHPSGSRFRGPMAFASWQIAAVTREDVPWCSCTAADRLGARGAEWPPSWPSGVGNRSPWTCVGMVNPTGHRTGTIALSASPRIFKRCCGACPRNRFWWARRWAGSRRCCWPGNFRRALPVPSFWWTSCRTWIPPEPVGYMRSWSSGWNRGSARWMRWPI